MTAFIIEVEFKELTHADVTAVYDQTDELVKAVEKALTKLPIGEREHYVASYVE